MGTCDNIFRAISQRNGQGERSRKTEVGEWSREREVGERGRRERWEREVGERREPLSEYERLLFTSEPFSSKEKKKGLVVKCISVSPPSLYSSSPQVTSRGTFFLFFFFFFYQRNTLVCFVLYEI